MNFVRMALLQLSYVTKGFIQFNFPNRKAGTQVYLVCLSQAIMIITPDGNNVVLTPTAMRDLLKKAPEAIVAATAPMN